MKYTKSESVSDPASAMVYELDGRRFVVDTAYPNDKGLHLAQLLIRCMVNDGKPSFGNHDAAK